MKTIITAILLLLASCVSTGSIPLTDQVFPPRPKDHPIQMYAAGAELSRPYLRLARLTGNGSSSANWSAVRESMKERARLLGADALLLEDSYSVSQGSTTNFYGNSASTSDVRSKHIKATAIRYTDERADTFNEAQAEAQAEAVEVAAVEEADRPKQNWSSRSDDQ